MIRWASRVRRRTSSSSRSRARSRSRRPRSIPTTVTVAPPVRVAEDSSGSVLAAAPVWATVSSCAVSPARGARPRSVLSRSVTAKSCSGTVMESNALTLRDSGAMLSRAARALSIAFTTSVLQVSESSRALGLQFPSPVKLGSGGRLSEGFCGGSMPAVAWAPLWPGRVPDAAGADMPGRTDAPLTGAVPTPPATVAEKTPSPISVFQVLRCMRYFFPGGSPFVDGSRRPSG